MNKRILEIYKLSNDFDEEEMEHFFNAVKFAELIVQDCATIADKCVQERLDYPGARIKEHFGIEP